MGASPPFSLFFSMALVAACERPTAVSEVPRDAAPAVADVAVTLTTVTPTVSEAPSCADPPPSRPAHPARAVPPAYPQRWRRLAHADADARAARFRQDNPGSFTIAGFDAAGMVQTLQTKDPCLAVVAGNDDTKMTAGDVARWTAFVLGNGEAFGVDDSTALSWDVAPSMRGATPEMTAWQTVGTERLASIHVVKSGLGNPHRGSLVTITGHFWPGARQPPPAVVDPDSLRAPLLGQPYVKTEVHLGMPCDPIPGMPASQPCGEAPSEKRQTLTIDAKSLHVLPHVELVLAKNAVELRRTFEVTLGGMSTAAGLPRTVDALTRESVTRCGSLPSCSSEYLDE